MPIEKDFPLMRIDFEALRAKNPNRLETDESWAKELGQRQQDDDWDWDKEIPIIFVSEEGEDKRYTPASGVHRLLGRYLAGFDSYPKVEVCTGTKEDFMQAAIASNKDDNERKALSREDKRKVLQEIFESLEFWGKSPDTIVRLTGFARSFVFSFRKDFLAKLREDDPSKAAFLEKTYEESKKNKEVTRRGKTFKVNASSIGKTPRTAQTEEEAATEVGVAVEAEAEAETEIEIESTELDELVERLAAKEGVTAKELLTPGYWIPRYAKLIGLESEAPAIAQEERIVHCGEPRLFSIKNDPVSQVRIEPGDVLIFKEGELLFDLYDNGEPVALEAVGAAA